MSVDAEVVVVGAGIAGSLTRAAAGPAGTRCPARGAGSWSSAVEELPGGVLFGRGSDEIVPDFATTAPVERRVVRHQLALLDGDAASGWSSPTLAWPIR